MTIIPRNTPAVFRRGDLVVHDHLPMIVVFVKDGYADLAPGHDLAAAPAVGHVLARVTKLTRRPMHYVTIEPVRPDDPALYVSDWDTPPRLAIVEHRPGHPPYNRGTEGWIPLGEMCERARAVAARLGAAYVEPRDELAIELLSQAVA